MALFAPITELFIDGEWVDVSDDVRYELAVDITRGRADEQADLSASMCKLTLNNRDGRYCNRNPHSPYFGLLGRNTPLRQRVAGFDSYVLMRGVYTSNVNTADKAALDITGDIDIRIDVEPDTWRPPAPTALISKWSSGGNQRSWGLTVSTAGALYFAYSADGAAFKSATSTAVAKVTGRLAVRVVVDVVNGANHTVTFYTGTGGVTGAWTQLGPTVTVAGNTSLYASSAPLELGTANSGGIQFAGDRRFVGKFYRAQVLQGIAGTVRADANFTTLDPYATSLSDGTNTWTVYELARVGNDGYRFFGEVAAMPTEWDLSGKDIWVPVDAAGVTRRLTQGAPPLRSAIYRNLVQYNPAGYWSLEDDGNATAAASTAPGGGTRAQAVDVTFGSDDTLPGSASTAVLNSTGSRISGQVRGRTAAAGWSVMLFFKLASIPGVATPLLTFGTSGTANRWRFGITNAGYELDAFNVDGVNVATSFTGFGTGAEPNKWIAVQIEATQSGGTVDWAMVWHPVGTDDFFASTGSFAGSVGSPRNFTISGNAGGAGAAVAHMFIGDHTLPFVAASFYKAANGYQGESAIARFRRLCAEEGVPAYVDYAGVDDSALMGRQAIATLMDNLGQVPDADLGVLYEPRDALGLTYRPRTDLYDQTAVQFDYAAGHIAAPFKPTDDDQAIRNDITVSRIGGSSHRAVQLTGPLNVQRPQDDPDGVGTYVDGPEVSLADDDQLADVAGFKLMLGTWDEQRFPSITLKLHNSSFTGDPDATRRAVGLDAVDLATVVNLPAWLPPQPAVVLAQGFTERITPDEFEIQFNATPGRPWNTALVDTGTAPRIDADTTLLAEDLTTTETAVDIDCVDDPAWTTDPAEWGFPIVIGGEEMTVDAVSAPVGTIQTLTVTRSVNGVVKAHTAGPRSLVRLATSAYVGL